MPTRLSRSTLKQNTLQNEKRAGLKFPLGGTVRPSSNLFLSFFFHAFEVVRVIIDNGLGECVYHDKLHIAERFTVAGGYWELGFPTKIFSGGVGTPSPSR